MSQLYPLKFTPQYQEKIWGGTKLAKLLNKPFPTTNLIGESWEISDIEDFPSIVANGFLKSQSLPAIIETFKGDLLGNEIYKRFGNRFPLLIKFLDAADKLSVQVHPGDNWAKKYHNSLGKNEMWYIIDADHGATTTIGLKPNITKKDYQEALDQDKVNDALNVIPVKKGDVFHIPTGRIHAIGAGIMIAEIQQTSDITYRIYDYDRTDKQGNKRELHNEMAKEVIDYQPIKNFKTEYKRIVDQSNRIIRTPDFTTNFLKLTQNRQKDFTNLDSFVIYLCLEGQLKISHKKRSIMISKGESALIPASINIIDLEIHSPCELLEVHL